MGKEWGHGFHQGVAKTTDVWLDISMDFAKQYAESKRKWQMETIAENMKRSGLYLLGLCPFHKEKTPSCTYDAVSDTYKCLGCGKTGSGYELAQAYA